MAAEGVLVFDAEEVPVVAGGTTDRSFVLLEDQMDVLVFDALVSRDTLDEPAPSSDFFVFDTAPTIADQVVAEPDFLLLDPAKEPTRVVLEGTGEDFLILTAGGPTGATGEAGPAGPQGLPGQDGPGVYFQEFNFASPATTWTVVHNRNSVGLNVETLDTNGDPLEGYVRFVDMNTIEIDWYYPTAGSARLFR